ncbi:MAG: hypothetical protein U0003_02360 [Vampirovibrionales bacterium]
MTSAPLLLDAERAHSALYKLLRLSPPDGRYGDTLHYLYQTLSDKRNAHPINTPHTWLA